MEADPVLKAAIGDDIDDVLNPAEYIGFAPQLIDKAVKRVRKEINAHE